MYPPTVNLVLKLCNSGLSVLKKTHILILPHSEIIGSFLLANRVLNMGTKELMEG